MRGWERCRGRGEEGNGQSVGSWPQNKEEPGSSLRGLVVIRYLYLDCRRSALSKGRGGCLINFHSQDFTCQAQDNTYWPFIRYTISRGEIPQGDMIHCIVLLYYHQWLFHNEKQFQILILNFFFCQVSAPSQIHQTLLTELTFTLMNLFHEEVWVHEISLRP